MTSHKTRLYLAAICFVLLSWSGERGNRMAVKMYADQSNIAINQTSKNDITRNYQYPDFVWIDKSGNTVYNYQYTRVSPTFISYIPWISAVIINRVRTNNYDISLTFDKQEKLMDASFFHDTFVY